MSRVFHHLLIFLALIAGAIALLFSLGPTLFPSIAPQITHFEQTVALPGFMKIKSVAEMLPLPLRIPSGQSGVLTSRGVFVLTNAARVASSSVPLVENARLDASAKAKLADLFARQYFEHVSPTGKGPSDLAEAAGYDYILIGENLALGDFKDDAALMAAWMASPGHRANILNPRFREIGIAVGRGTYQGEKTWIAVQEFGLARNACPQTDAELKSRIDAEIAQSDAMKAKLDQEKAAIAATPQNDPSYNQKAEQYNSEVPAYNSLVEKIKSDTQIYNTGVQKVNACLAG